jgi:hypothetical protein
VDLSVSGIPNDNIGVFRARDEELSIGGEGDGLHGALVDKGGDLDEGGAVVHGALARIPQLNRPLKNQSVIITLSLAAVSSPGRKRQWPEFRLRVIIMLG